MLLRLRLTLLLLRLTLWLLSRLALLTLLSLWCLLSSHLALLLLHIGHAGVHGLTRVRASGHLWGGRSLLRLSLRTMLLLLLLLLRLCCRLLLLLVLGLLLLLLLECELLSHHLLLGLGVLSLLYEDVSYECLRVSVQILSTYRSEPACLLPHMMHLLHLLRVQLQTHGHASLHITLKSLLRQ